MADSKLTVQRAMIAGLSLVAAGSLTGLCSMLSEQRQMRIDMTQMQTDHLTKDDKIELLRRELDNRENPPKWEKDWQIIVNARLNSHDEHMEHLEQKIDGLIELTIQKQK